VGSSDDPATARAAEFGKVAFQSGIQRSRNISSLIRNPSEGPDGRSAFVIRSKIQRVILELYQITDCWSSKFKVGCGRQCKLASVVGVLRSAAMWQSRFRHVDRFIDRHGKPRCYFRAGRGPRIRLPGEPGSAEFLAAYATAARFANDAGSLPAPVSPNVSAVGFIESGRAVRLDGGSEE